jgi:lipopolysaccharide biosynthesis glycosyltransferase
MEKKLAIVLGITPDLSFAAGVMLISLKRHLAPHVDAYDVLIIHDGELDANDTRLFQKICPNCALIDYKPLYLDVSALPPDFHPAYIYRFEVFRMLDTYKTLIWLDCDLAIQDDISELLEYGPLAMAIDNLSIPVTSNGLTLQTNFKIPLEGYDMNSAFYNTGVIVFQDTIHDPLQIYEWCMNMFTSFYDILNYQDQPVLNMLVQKHPDMFTSFPTEKFNSFVPFASSNTAAIVHAIGRRKFWNDAFVALSYPEWQRDYHRWLKMGGSRYSGNIFFHDFSHCGTYQLFKKLLSKKTPRTP